MAWFPSLGLYGSWDSDHHTVMVFPGIGWADIMRRPEVYAKAQWYPTALRTDTCDPRTESCATTGETNILACRGFDGGEVSEDPCPNASTAEPAPHPRPLP